MASSKIVKTSHFSDFEQVIIKLDILLTLNKSSNTINKLPWSNQMPRHSFFWGHYPVTSTPPWLLRHVKASTSSELYPDTRLLGFFFKCLGTKFFNSSHVTYRTPCRTRGHSHSPKEAEDFPRGGNHSKHMPPLTYLAWLQPMCYNSRLVFIHINTGKAFTYGENFDKKYRAAATPIRNHNSQILDP